MEALSVLASAKRAVESELTGLRGLLAAFDGMLAGPFTRAVDLIKGTPGRVIVTGIGKSGHVARKIAATLSSTGTPALFLHPAEASHGDLGMITPGDVALALSWSGESPELLHVVNYCKRFGVPLIGISSEPKSALAKAATIALTLPRAAEACSIGLAPTTSTTMQMALGDALAVTLLEEKGFSAHDFRNFHPGGRLGAQLVTVREIMTQGEVLPRLRTTSTLSDAILEISRGRLGGAAVVDEDGRLIGAFTDGDLRRALPEANLEATVAEHMSRQPVFVAPSLLATEALLMMTERPRPILLMFVCEGTKLVGAVHMHDLLRAGVA
jgi:arabinose-5-phosphate isomerase